jgi:hypothetical protein
MLYRDSFGETWDKKKCDDAWNKIAPNNEISKAIVADRLVESLQSSDRYLRMSALYLIELMRPNNGLIELLSSNTQLDDSMLSKILDSLINRLEDSSRLIRKMAFDILWNLLITNKIDKQTWELAKRLLLMIRAEETGIYK